MDINSLPSINKVVDTDSESFDDEIEAINKTNLNKTLTDTETQKVIDHATGLLQTLANNTISEHIIRKMPSEEYTHLLSLLDEIISGSIDKQV